MEQFNEKIKALRERRGWSQEDLAQEVDAVSIHALSTLLHYVVALDERADPVKLKGYQ